MRVSGDEAKTDPRRRFGLETEQRGEKEDKCTNYSIDLVFIVTQRLSSIDTAQTSATILHLMVVLSKQLFLHRSLYWPPLLSPDFLP